MPKPAQLDTKHLTKLTVELAVSYQLLIKLPTKLPAKLPTKLLMKLLHSKLPANLPTSFPQSSSPSSLLRGRKARRGTACSSAFLVSLSRTKPLVCCATPSSTFPSFNWLAEGRTSCIARSNRKKVESSSTCSVQGPLAFVAISTLAVAFLPER